MAENKLINDYMLEAEQRYMFGGNLFIVEPSFKKEGKKTLAAILLNLMQSEVETS